MSNLILPKQAFRIRSFVGRNSRKTAAQTFAYQTYFPLFGLRIEDGLMHGEQIFGRKGEQLLEIGYGSGESLLACAKAYPDKDFIGVETYQPGMGKLLLGIKAAKLSNIRLFNGDVIDVLEQCIGEHSLKSIQIFFPDPWQKRRHHPRRLIQASFVTLLLKKLQAEGHLHLATDWEDYAKQMMQVLTKEKNLINLAGENNFAARSPYRPLVTKFEKRANLAGRLIWELQFKKQELIAVHK